MLGFIFRLPLWFALVLVAVPAVFVVVNQRGGLPCFCPMHIGFDVFGAHEFEQVVKFVGLHGQVAVVGAKPSRLRITKPSQQGALVCGS